MNHKITALSLLMVSLIAILYGFILVDHPEFSGVCGSGTYGGCLNETWFYGIGLPLWKSLYLLPILFLGLIFVRKEVFWGWLKFITIFFVAGVYLIVITDPFPSIPWPDRTSLTQSVVTIWVGLSALFIAGKYWILNRKTRK